MPPFATPNVPVTPVVRGRPVALVSVAALGVPRLGVVNAGLVASTMPPEPVTFCPSAVATPVPNDVMPVPPLATASTPLIAARSLVATRTKSVPFQAINAARPDATVIPELAEGLTTTDCDVDVALMTRYTLLAVGTVTVNVLAGLPVQLMMLY